MVTRAGSGQPGADEGGPQRHRRGAGGVHTDHGVYPQVAPTPGTIDKDWNGARMLCRALIGPGPAVRFLNGGVVDEKYIPDGKGAEGPDPDRPRPGLPHPRAERPGLRALPAARTVQDGGPDIAAGGLSRPATRSWTGTTGRSCTTRR